MRSRVMLRSLISLFILFIQFGLNPYSSVLQAHAQTPTFSIVSPYYGTATINSYFDHRYPTYNGIPNCVRWDSQGNCLEINDRVVRYDGREQTGGVSRTGCGLHPDFCYDGHNGYDFGMVFSHVLAAADGTVFSVGWDNPLCHYCGYGLHITIDHRVNGNVYRTNYAHLTTTMVEIGQIVKAGEMIGLSGGTGSTDGASHLHFTFRIA